MALGRRAFILGAAGWPAAARLVSAQRSRSAAAATAALRAAIPRAEADPSRPVYHFRPPANWTNDPNGTIFYKGWHHLFYQLNPAEPRAGNQHWGHARSRDLVNWEHLPIALWPLTDRGETANYSGGAILGADGRPRIFYTSIGHADPEQWMAVPTDDELIGWERPALNPVLAVGAHGATSVAQWRDPFLFREGGDTYMVCGGNTNASRGGGGSVFLYRASNAELTRWDYLGVVFRCGEREIVNVECPNLFRLGDKWVLLMSPHTPCRYFVGTLDLARPAFVPETRGVLDPGAAYASNISVDDRGRTILWLWGRTHTPVENGWNGVMVLPRILSIDADGFLRQQPAPEFESLRGAPQTKAAFDVPLGTPVPLDPIAGDCLELQADLLPGAAGEIGFDVRVGSEGRPGLPIRLTRGALLVGSLRAPLSRGADRHRLRVFLDKRVVEVYVNDGEAAVYTTTDAAVDERAIVAVARPSTRRVGAPSSSAQRVPRIENLTAWALKPAGFTLDRFVADRL